MKRRATAEFRTVGSALLTVMVVGAGVTAAKAKEDDTRLAKRDEAAAAFMRGCRKEVDAAPELSNEQRRIVCDEATACVIDAMFERDGRRKRQFSEIGNFVGPCLTRAREKAYGQPASKPGAATGSKQRAPDGDGLVACAREMKPAALKKLLAQCRSVVEDSEWVCDPLSPCLFIKRAITESCAVLDKAAAPAFCRAGAPPK